MRICCFLFIFFSFFAIGGIFAQQINIDEIQREIIKNKAKWNASHNKMTMLPEDQIKKLFGLKKFSWYKKQPNITPYRFGDVSSLMPSSFDWRNKDGNNYVTSIKNQGNCGACWAFATAAALESYTMIANNTPNWELDISEQTLLSCSDAGDCVGGFLQLASDFLVRAGAPLDTCFPYREFQDSCSNACANWQESAYKIDGWIYISNGPATPELLKEALFKYGPLIAAMDIYGDFLAYESGVYQHVWGNYLGGHGVLIVGYNDAEQSFTVKNQFGSDWGENGYFRISYTELTSAVDFGYITLAYYKNKNKLFVNKIGSGVVTDNMGLIDCGFNCMGEYPFGTSVTLFARGDYFKGWLGEACGGKGPCELNMYRTNNVSAIFAKTNIYPKAAAKLDNDNKLDIISLDASNNIFYTIDLFNWRQIPGELSAIVAGDFNKDSRVDLAGSNISGNIYCTMDLKTWINIPGQLTSLIKGDFDGDGRDDLAGINGDGHIFYTTDLRIWNNVPGELRILASGDFDGDGRDDLAGINSDGFIFFSTDLKKWKNIPGKLKKIVVSDIDGDKKSDLIGLTGKNEIYYTTDLKNWINIPGSLVEIAIGDLDGDGKRDIVGLNSHNEIWWNSGATNQQFWRSIDGALKSLITGDFNGDGKDDIAGVGTDGIVYFATNLKDWSPI